MKSKNYIYLLLTGIIILFFVFFLSSRIWMGDDREEKDMNFGQSLSVADVWDIKVTNARYDKEKRLLEVEYYSKIRFGSTAAPPEIKAILSKAVSNPIYMKISDMPDNPNGQYIQISNMPENWYYIKLQFTAERPEGETREPTTDKFGALQTYPDDTQTDRKQTRTVQIDYRMCEQTDLEVRKGTVSLGSTDTEEDESTSTEPIPIMKDEIKQKSDSLKVRIYDKNQELEGLRKQLKSYLGQRTALEQEVEEGPNPSQSEIDALNKKISKINGEITVVETEIGTLENELKKLNGGGK